MVAVFAIVALASMFQASIGFGANLIAQPIVFQLAPDLVPGSVLMATALLSCLVVIRERHAVTLAPIRSATSGAIIGIVTGVVVLQATPESGVALLVAVCVLAMVIVAAVGGGPAPSGRNLFLAGSAGGFGSTTAGIGGPPVALLFAGADGARTRGLLSGYFVAVSALTFVGLIIAERFGIAEARSGLLLLPAALLGFVASRPLLPAVDRRGIRPSILAVSAAAAVVLLARTVLG